MIKKIVGKFKNSSENSRNVIVNAMGAFAVKGMALVISLLTMPAYLRFFGDETALGLWFTVVSVLNWVLNFDLGIGSGLRNHLTITLAQKNHEESKRYISSAYLSIGAICILISAVFFIAFDFINWNAVFNISTEIVSSKALLISVKIVFIGLVLQMFLNLICSILYAMQKSSVNNFLQLCTSIIILVLVSVLPSRSNEENIICMAIIHCLAVVLPFLMASVVVFSRKNNRKIMPSVRSFSKKHAKAVLTLGGTFLIVQLVYMIVMNTNEYLITFFTDNENVVDYQVYHRLFALGSTAFSLALTPIWSAVTKALAEKNKIWVKSLYKKLVLVAMAGCACEFILVFFMQFVVNIWLGENAITVNPLYSVVFAFMGSFMIINSVLSSVANGTGKLKVQLICFTAGAVAKPFLAWGMVTFTGSWIGVVLANIIALLPFCIIQPLWLYNYFKREEN